VRRILPTEPNGEASSVHARQMTEFAYFLRRGFRNCEILCNPTKVSPRPQRFCLHWRRSTFDTANHPACNRLQPFPALPI
jgi:hypothetical protein